MQAALTPPRRAARREPHTPHNMTRLSPGRRRPHLTPWGVTHWAAPKPHTDDAPYHHRPPQPTGSTPGREPIHSNCRRAPRATAARIRPDQAWPRPTPPTGQRQRPHSPAEPPRSQPSPMILPSFAPCSDPLLPATPPGSATERHAKPCPEEATWPASRWTTAQTPSDTRCARQHHAHFRSCPNPLTQQNPLTRPSSPWAPAEAKPGAHKHEPCPTIPNPRA